jgi:hypothetical protein
MNFAVTGSRPIQKHADNNDQAVCFWNGVRLWRDRKNSDAKNGAPHSVGLKRIADESFRGRSSATVVG